MIPKVALHPRFWRSPQCDSFTGPFIHPLNYHPLTNHPQITIIHSSFIRQSPCAASRADARGLQVSEYSTSTFQSIVTPYPVYTMFILWIYHGYTSVIPECYTCGYLAKWRRTTVLSRWSQSEMRSYTIVNVSFVFLRHCSHSALQLLSWLRFSHSAIPPLQVGIAIASLSCLRFRFCS
jgi:hypothetical protein